MPELERELEKTRVEWFTLVKECAPKLTMLRR